MKGRCPRLKNTTLSTKQHLGSQTPLAPHSAHSLGLRNEKGVTRSPEAFQGIRHSCCWFRASFPTVKGLQRPTVLAQFISSNFLESPGYSVTCLQAVIKQSDKSKLRKGGLILAHRSRIQSFLSGRRRSGSRRGREREAASHGLLRKHDARTASSQLTLSF